MTKADIARLISELRKKSGQSQLQVSEKSKVSFRTYQRIEAGEISPRIETVFKILNALNADISHIFLDWFKTNLDKTNTNIPVAAGGFDYTTTKVVQQPLLIEDYEIAGVIRALSNEYDRGLAEFGYWEWNLSTNQFYWSERMFEIYDMDPTQPFDRQIHHSKIHPEDYNQIEIDLNELLHKNRKYENTHRILYKDGVGHVRSMAKKVKTKDNQVIVFGIAEKVRSKN